MHAIFIVGYDKKDGLDYYTIRNSWYSSFGQEGYCKILCHLVYCKLYLRYFLDHKFLFDSLSSKRIDVTSWTNELETMTHGFMPKWILQIDCEYLCPYLYIIQTFHNIPCGNRDSNLPSLKALTSLLGA